MSETTTPPEPRRALPKQRRRGWRILAIVLAVLLAAAVGTAAYVAVRAKMSLSSINRETGFQPTDDDSARPTLPAENGPINILLLGIDDRVKANSDSDRSDAMIVAHIPASRDTVYLISIPRDAWVPIHGREYAKVNAAFEWGGTPLAILTTEDMLGVRIQHVVTIDMAGFIQLTEVLGGITFNNPVESYEPKGDYRWPSGEITIVDPKEALAFVRQRKPLPNGDLDRTLRQRAFLKGMVDKILSAGVLGNPARFSDVLSEISDTLSVDEDFTDERITSMALSMRVNSSDDLESVMVPIAGYDWSSDRQSIDIVDWDKLAELRRALAADDVASYVTKYGEERGVTNNMPEVPVPEGTPDVMPWDEVEPAETPSLSPSPSPSR